MPHHYAFNTIPGPAPTPYAARDPLAPFITEKDVDNPVLNEFLSLFLKIPSKPNAMRLVQCNTFYAPDPSNPYTSSYRIQVKYGIHPDGLTPFKYNLILTSRQLTSLSFLSTLFKKLVTEHNFPTNLNKNLGEISDTKGPRTFNLTRSNF